MLKSAGYDCNGCDKTIFNGEGALLILPNGDRYAFCDSKCLTKWLATFNPPTLNQVLSEKLEARKKENEEIANANGHSNNVKKAKKRKRDIFETLNGKRKPEQEIVAGTLKFEPRPGNS